MIYLYAIRLNLIGRKMTKKCGKTISTILTIATVVMGLARSGPARADFNLGEEIRDTVLIAARNMRAPVKNMREIGRRPPEVSARGIEQAVTVAVDIWRDGIDGLDNFGREKHRMFSDGGPESRNFVTMVVWLVGKVDEIVEDVGGIPQAQVRERARLLLSGDGQWSEVEGGPNHNPVEDIGKHVVAFGLTNIMLGLSGTIIHAIRQRRPEVVGSANPAGIPNLGNTCYYNALAQAMGAMPGEMAESLDNSERGPLSLKDNAARAAIIFSMLNAKYTIADDARRQAAHEAPQALLQYSFDHRDMWSVNCQQDAHEALIGYLGTLDRLAHNPVAIHNEQLKARTLGREMIERSNQSVVRHELDVHRPYHIPDSMNEVAEVVERGREDALETSLTISCSKARPEQCIIACLRRFERDNERNTSNKITSPAECVPLHISHTDQGWVAGDERYQLYDMVAAIMHGGSLGGGHYTAVVWRNGGWWYCNDSVVRQITEEEAHDYATNNGYIIMYNRATP
jgi:hypothetical protein